MMQYYCSLVKVSYVIHFEDFEGFLKASGSEMFADKILYTLTLFLLEVTVYEIEYEDWGVMAVY